MARTILEIKKAEHLDSTRAQNVRESLARKQIHRYESIYLRCVSGTTGLQQLWVIGTRLLIAKLWKMTLVGFQGTNLDREQIKEQLFIYNTEILDKAHQLPNKLGPFGWSFRCKYTQWHAIVYLLMELCTRTEGPAVEHAWNVLDGVFRDLGEGGKGSLGKPDQEVNCKSTLWPPLQRLLKRARTLRAQAAHKRDTQSTMNTPSTLTASDFSAKTVEPIERVPQPEMFQQHEVLLGDPFFGSNVGVDFSEKMNWDQLDNWVMGLYSQEGLQEGMDFDSNGSAGPLAFW